MIENNRQVDSAIENPNRPRDKEIISFASVSGFVAESPVWDFLVQAKPPSNKSESSPSQTTEQIPEPQEVELYAVEPGVSETQTSDSQTNELIP